MSDTTIIKDTIATVHYKGTITGTDEVFDSSYEREEPLSFLVGHGQMIPGFEAALMNKGSGDQLTVHIPCAEAYGERDDEALQQIPLAHLPEGVEVGVQLAAQTESGHVIPVRVVALDDSEATLDFNHELAGQDLTFEIQVISVRPATEEELAHGHAHGPEGHDHH